MPVLNYKEIPQANIANGNQDKFELFARDFFELLGFRIIEGPDRGQDGGRDLVIEEERRGIFNSSRIRWMVSCKHKSHSGKSVNDSDEQDISDRVKVHNCKGFIGFYSTVISSPLGRKLKELEKSFEVKIFDGESIETILLKNNKGTELIKRYFPRSYETINDKTPSNLLEDYKPLCCECCGKDLLENPDNYEGIVVFATSLNEDKSKAKIVDIYFSCKGNCDDYLDEKAWNNGCTTAWEDISDVIIPFEYLKFIMAILNRLKNQVDIYEEDAYKKLKEFIIAISQIVLRTQSDADIQRSVKLQMLPDGL